MTLLKTKWYISRSATFFVHSNTFHIQKAPHTTWTLLYCREKVKFHTHTHIQQHKVGRVVRQSTQQCTILWLCLSEAWRCVSKLLVKVKRKAPQLGTAYSGVTFKKRTRAALSSSKEVVLFQCMSHLALMLYLWLRGWALALAQPAVQPIDSQRDRERGEKKKRWSREREGEKEG